MSTRHVPQEVKDRVDAEINRCIDIAEKTYDRSFRFPLVVYTKRGTVAGTANDSSYKINLNSVLLMENLDKFIDGRKGRGTVTHEFAHLVDGIVNPSTRRSAWRRKRSVHGPTWKRIMRLFGVRNPSRCHSYDTTNSRVRKGRKAGTIIVRCSCGCKRQGPMGAKRAAKWRMNPSNYWYHRGHALIEVKPKVPVMVAAEKAKPVARKKVKAGSKLAKAVKLLRAEPEMTRQELIISIRVLCGASEGYAPTLYNQAKKLV